MSRSSELSTQSESSTMLLEKELERLGEERWYKLRQYFGISQADMSAYEDFQTLNRVKVRQLLGHMPSVDEHLKMRQHNRNVKIDILLQRWNQEMDDLIRARRKDLRVAGVSREDSPHEAKSSRVLGVCDQDVDYYTRFDKAVRVLGDAPVREA